MLVYKHFTSSEWYGNLQSVFHHDSNARQSCLYTRNQTWTSTAYQNFRPISNLKNISKIPILIQMKETHHFISYFSPYQSATCEHNPFKLLSHLHRPKTFCPEIEMHTPRQRRDWDAGQCVQDNIRYVSRSRCLRLHSSIWLGIILSAQFKPWNLNTLELSTIDGNLLGGL